MHRARQDNGLVVVSIFVNPLQFGPQEDLGRYPKPLEQDQQLCAEVGVDVIFAPSVEELYGTEHMQAQRLTQVIPPAEMMTHLCGPGRPGHFEGVATVVTKLLTIVQPNSAYFGQKDAQQLAIIRRLVRDLNLPVDIIGCPIIREESGLAYSSRNQYLSAEERQQAIALHRGLSAAESLFRQGERDASTLIATVQHSVEPVPDLQPEYIELVHPDTMRPLEQVETVGLLAIAARLGTTRLIDNVILRNRQPIVAIDGPAGAGKSTVVQQVAQQLNLLHIDTGAMYRAVTWLALQRGICIEDHAAIAEMVSQCQVQLVMDASAPKGYPAYRVLINGQDVTQAIRQEAVTSQVSAIAAQPVVRQVLVQQQRHYGLKGGIVMEGRDIGTNVFPDAELKIFLTASVQERAKRRQQDLLNQGQNWLALDVLEQAIGERDYKDSTRAIAPLRKAPDAIEIDTDYMTIDEVTAKIVQLYGDRCSLESQ
jgi:pantoate ligase/cytidylate kinase